MHPPFHSAVAQLTCKVGTLLGRNTGIVRAQADQHLALDVSGVLRPGGRKAAVKADDAAHIRAASRQFQRHGAAEAESDRSDPAGVHFRSRACAKRRSEEHTSELQSLMRISYAVFCLQKKKPYPLQTETPADDATR